MLIFIFKPYLDAHDGKDIYELIEMDYSPKPVLAHHDISNPDELCKTEGFQTLNTASRTPMDTSDTIQLETAISTISQEYLLEFTSEYGISEDLHPELPGPGERIVDFLEGKVDVFQQETEEKQPSMLYQAVGFLKKWHNRFFWVDEGVFLTVADWRTSAPKDEMPTENTYSSETVMVLNTHRTPIQKQPEVLLCLVGLSRRYFLIDEVYPTFLYDDDRNMDLFNLIRAPNPTKVKTGTGPRAAHKRSPMDFTNKNPSQQSTGGNGTEDQGQEAVAPGVPPLENVTTTGVAPEAGQAERIAATGPRSTIRGKSLAAMGLGMGSTCPVPTSRDTPVDVSDPDPLSFADPQSLLTADVAQ
nr:transposase (putative), gypsy type [Tanacetum cinerariifolium]